MTRHDQAIHDLRHLLLEIGMGIEFGPNVSMDYALGYVTGRRDLIPHVDAVVSAIIDSLSDDRSDWATPGADGDQ